MDFANKPVYEWSFKDHLDFLEFIDKFYVVPKDTKPSHFLKRE